MCEVRFVAGRCAAGECAPPARASDSNSTQASSKETVDAIQGTPTSSRAFFAIEKQRRVLQLQQIACLAQFELSRKINRVSFSEYGATARSRRIFSRKNSQNVFPAPKNWILRKRNAKTIKINIFQVNQKLQKWLKMSFVDFWKSSFDCENGFNVRNRLF